MLVFIDRLFSMILGIHLSGNQAVQRCRSAADVIAFVTVIFVTEIEVCYGFVQGCYPVYLL